MNGKRQENAIPCCDVRVSACRQAWQEARWTSRVSITRRAATPTSSPGQQGFSPGSRATSALTLAASCRTKALTEALRAAAVPGTPEVAACNKMFLLSADSKIKLPFQPHQTPPKPEWQPTGWEPRESLPVARFAFGAECSFRCYFLPHQPPHI
jgi:hypothetical protein